MRFHIKCSSYHYACTIPTMPTLPVLCQLYPLCLFITTVKKYQCAPAYHLLWLLKLLLFHLGVVGASIYCCLFTGKFKIEALIFSCLSYFVDVI